jgi:FKBP-type peptidyl-prolyl cis-trans isomerase SlpA
MSDSTDSTDGAQLIGKESDRRISEGSRVKLHFSLHLTSGEEIDTTRRGRPATFDYGDGKLLPGFEEALLGMRAGDDAQLHLQPEQAFGAHRQENIQLLERKGFDEEALEPGLIVSFNGPGGELPGVVTRIFEERVEVDFNHPLAGREIIFDVSILKVEDAEDTA